MTRAPNDERYEHRHDDKLDYTTEHTGADPGRVVREERVPNEAKAVPTDNRTILFLSIASAALSVLAVILSYVLELEWVGLALAVIALLLGIVGLFSAHGDRRAGMVTPGIVTAVAAIVALVILFGDMTDADPEATADEMNERLVAPAGDAEALDGDADLGDIPDPDDDATDAPVVDPELDPN